jgi:hypothetical protein
VRKVIRTITTALVVLGLGLALTACPSNADVASHNLSKAADSFEVLRRVVFYNGITGEYMLVIEGFCSLGNNDPVDELSVTCQTGLKEFKKHFLGLSDNVSYFVEQLQAANVSTGHYRVIFKPSVIVPDIDAQ